MIAKLTGRQIRAARGLAGWTAVDLASASKVGVATIRRAEVENGPVKLIPANETALIRALEAVGIEFIPENGGGVGVRMRESAPVQPATPHEPVVAPKPRTDKPKKGTK